MVNDNHYKDTLMYLLAAVNWYYLSKYIMFLSHLVKFNKKLCSTWKLKWPRWWTFTSWHVTIFSHNFERWPQKLDLDNIILQIDYTFLSFICLFICSFIRNFVTLLLAVNFMVPFVIFSVNIPSVDLYVCFLP